MRETDHRSRKANEVQLQRLGFAGLLAVINQSPNRNLHFSDRFQLASAALGHWSYRLRVSHYPAPLLLGARSPTASQLQGIAHALPCNRRSSCWILHELGLVPSRENSATTLALALVHGAINGAPACSCWLARVKSTDRERLALFRQAGFQPILTQGIWWLDPEVVDPSASGLVCPQGYTLKSFKRDHAPMVLSLDNATTPIQVRRLLDRGGDDLSDETVAGLLLLSKDRSHKELAAAIRLVNQPPYLWQSPHRPCRMDIAVHPGHELLYSSGVLKAGLLHLLTQRRRHWKRFAASGLELRCNPGQTMRQGWLQNLGARNKGEELLLARSVWRRQDSHGHSLATGRLKSMLQRLGPRGQPVPDGSDRLPMPLDGHRS